MLLLLSQNVSSSPFSVDNCSLTFLSACLFIFSWFNVTLLDTILSTVCEDFFNIIEIIFTITESNANQFANFM